MRGVYIAFPDDTITCETGDGEVYLAGERVPPGVYRQIGTRREICLECEDMLPASLDGRVACYERVLHTWEQIQQRHRQEKSLPE